MTAIPWWVQALDAIGAWVLMLGFLYVIAQMRKAYDNAMTTEERVETLESRIQRLEEAVQVMEEQD